jgi:F0F1-type ATP synthase membrane subunit b/b'
VEEHAPAAFDYFRGAVLPYFNFLVFFVLAIVFFKKMVINAAAKQKTDFEKQMAEARTARDAAVQRLEELKRRQTGLESEIADVMSMSKEAATLEAKKIEADADRLAAHLKDEARRIAHAEVEKARLALRQEIVEAVREGVAKKLKSEMTPDSQLKLVKKQIGELKSIHP